MKQWSRVEHREGDVAMDAANTSVSQKNQEQIERARVITEFFEDHAWEKNEWHDAIDDLYGRIDGSLLYRISRERDMIEEKEADEGEEIWGKVALLQEKRQKLSRIYEVLQEKDLALGKNDILRIHWLEKMKQMFIVDRIEEFHEEVFFETPQEERRRKRKEQRIKGEDIRGRVLKELEIIQDIRKNFPWKDIPLEITTNIGSFVLRILSAIGSEGRN